LLALLIVEMGGSVAPAGAGDHGAPGAADAHRQRSSLQRDLLDNVFDCPDDFLIGEVDARLAACKSAYPLQRYS
jgi:hypothetical protein